MVKAKFEERVVVDTNQIFGKAVAAAKAENRRLGIPNPFMKDGNKYYEMPDGTITDVRPAFFDKTMEELKQ